MSEFKNQVKNERLRLSQRESVSRVLNALGPGTGRVSLGPGRYRPEGVGSNRCLLKREFTRGGDFGDVRVVKEAMHSIYGCVICDNQTTESCEEVHPLAEETSEDNEVIERLLDGSTDKDLASGDFRPAAKYSSAKLDKSSSEADGVKYVDNELSADQDEEVEEEDGEWDYCIMQPVKNNYRIALGITDDEDDE